MLYLRDVDYLNKRQKNQKLNKMATLDAILNVAIPFLVISGLMFLIYKAAKEPIDKFAGWIKGLIQSGREKGQEEVGQFYSEIIYD